VNVPLFRSGNEDGGRDKTRLDMWQKTEKKNKLWNGENNFGM